MRGMEAINQQFPMFSPIATTNNYKSESIPLKVVDRKSHQLKEQHFFNNTATLVGLSSNLLLGTEFDEANADICEDDIAKPLVT